MDGEGGMVGLDEEMEGREGEDVRRGVEEGGVWEEAQAVGRVWEGGGGGVCVEGGGGVLSVEEGGGGVLSVEKGGGGVQSTASVFGSSLCLLQEEEGGGGGGRRGIWGAESGSLDSDWPPRSRESSCTTIWATSLQTE